MYIKRSFSPQVEIKESLPQQFSSDKNNCIEIICAISDYVYEYIQANKTMFHNYYEKVESKHKGVTPKTKSKTHFVSESIPPLITEYEFMVLVHYLTLEKDSLLKRRSFIQKSLKIKLGKLEFEDTTEECFKIDMNFLK